MLKQDGSDRPRLQRWRGGDGEGDRNCDGAKVVTRGEVDACGKMCSIAATAGL